jgi:uncharacterized protein (DUF1800 family)
MRSFTSFSPEKFTGTFDKDALKHLLKRTLIGFSWDDFKKFENKTLDETIEILFKEEPTTPPPINHYDKLNKDTTGIPPGETWVNAVYGDGNINSRRRQSLRGWWIHKMFFQSGSIHERLIMFWHNHFVTEVETYDDARYAYKYHQTLRKYALGNFKDFTKAITIDPAMLNYLNGTRNTKTAPDENYARELQELFTLGRGPNSKYTEDDVKAAAKVLTGYRVNKDLAEYYFDATRHDVTDKKFSEFYGSKTIKGQAGDNGKKELDEMISMIFENNEVGLFLIRRLYVFFFYYEITPAIEKQFIVPLAEIFRNNKYEILPVLKVMFSSQHFFDNELRGVLIKNPLDHTVGFTRTIEAKWPKYEAANYQEYYELAGDLITVANNGQQTLLNPPSVAGWPAYYQAPVFHEIWINASTLPIRVKFTETFIKSGLKRNGKTLAVDVISFVKKLPNPEDPVKLIETLEFILFQTQISLALKKQLKTDILLEGQTSDYYWTDLWNEHLTKPTTNNIGMVTTRLKSLLTYLVSLPEYQLS